MKAVVQRVTSASVTVNGKRISEIAQGFLVLVGLGQHDTASDCDWLANKLLSLRLFSDDQGTPWKKSVVDKQYEVLCGQCRHYQSDPMLRADSVPVAASITSACIVADLALTR